MNRSFWGRAGQVIFVEVRARRLGSPLDSVLRLTDATGKQLAINDDYEDPFQEIFEELADYNDSMALSHEEGWFYSDGG